MAEVQPSQPLTAVDTLTAPMTGERPTAPAEPEGSDARPPATPPMTRPHAASAPQPTSKSGPSPATSDTPADDEVGNAAHFEQAAAALAHMSVDSESPPSASSGSQSSASLDAHKLFIGQIPRHILEVELRTYFEPYGPIVDLVILRDKHTQVHRGCAFLTYAKAESAAAAIEGVHAKVALHNRPIVVRYAGASNAPTEVKLFVGMLSRASDAARIESLFSQYGAVSEVYLMKDAETAVSKGCAFVKMEKREEALAAINDLHEKFLDNNAPRKLVVRFADSKALKAKQQPYQQQLQLMQQQQQINQQQQQLQSLSLPGSPLQTQQQYIQNNISAQQLLASYQQQLQQQQQQQQQLQQQQLQQQQQQQSPLQSHFQSQSPPQWSMSPNASAFHPGRKLSGGVRSRPYVHILTQHQQQQQQQQHPLGYSYSPTFNPSFLTFDPSLSPSHAALAALGAAAAASPIHSPLALSLSQRQQAAAAAAGLTAAANLDHSSLGGGGNPDLFIYNLPSSLLEAELSALFSPFGTVLSTHIFRDPLTSASRGFGYVSFATSDAAAQAIKTMDGYVLDGKLLRVLPKEQRQTSHSSFSSVSSASLGSEPQSPNNIAQQLQHLQQLQYLQSQQYMAQTLAAAALANYPHHGQQSSSSMPTSPTNAHTTFHPSLPYRTTPRQSSLPSTSQAP